MKKTQYPFSAHLVFTVPPRPPFPVPLPRLSLNYLPWTVLYITRSIIHPPHMPCNHDPPFPSAGCAKVVVAVHRPVGLISHPSIHPSEAVVPRRPSQQLCQTTSTDGLTCTPAYSLPSLDVCHTLLTWGGDADQHMHTLATYLSLILCFLSRRLHPRFFFGGFLIFSLPGHLSKRLLITHPHLTTPNLT